MERSVSSLQELSGQLLVQAQGGESLEAQERVHVIGNRLRLLLNAITADLQLLERRLQTSGDTQVSLWDNYFLFTVLRKSLRLAKKSREGKMTSKIMKLNVVTKPSRSKLNQVNVGCDDPLLFFLFVLFLNISSRYSL